MISSVNGIRMYSTSKILFKLEALLFNFHALFKELENATNEVLIIIDEGVKIRLRNCC